MSCSKLDAKGAKPVITLNIGDSSSQASRKRNRAESLVASQDGGNTADAQADIPAAMLRALLEVGLTIWYPDGRTPKWNQFFESVHVDGQRRGCNLLERCVLYVGVCGPSRKVASLNCQIMNIFVVSL